MIDYGFMHEVALAFGGLMVSFSMIAMSAASGALDLEQARCMISQECRMIYNPGFVVLLGCVISDLMVFF